MKLLFLNILLPDIGFPDSSQEISFLFTWEISKYLYELLKATTVTDVFDQNWGVF